MTKVPVNSMNLVRMVVVAGTSGFSFASMTGAGTLTLSSPQGCTPVLVPATGSTICIT